MKYLFRFSFGDTFLSWFTFRTSLDLKRTEMKMYKIKRKLINRNWNQHKTDNHRKLKAEIQNEQRKDFWKYIENKIFDIPIPDQDNSKFRDLHKWLLITFNTAH